jgi:7-cyano-7-deazaguanine tRNA-ribosyltransferase
MTEYGTTRLKNLEYLPCSCPACLKQNRKKILEMTENEKQMFLSEHNLFICQTEVKRIKQAIREGRLWELLEIRAHSHPTILKAIKKLKKYNKYIERHSPVTKRRGIFIFDSIGLFRPEVVRHRYKIKQRYSPPKISNILLLVPVTQIKISRKIKNSRKIWNYIYKDFKGESNKIHICFYTAPFGLVPLELFEVYPLYQNVTVLPTDKESNEYVAEQIAEYIKHQNYSLVVLLYDHENWKENVLYKCKEVCYKKKIQFKCFSIKEDIMEKLLPYLHRNFKVSKKSTIKN